MGLDRMDVQAERREARAQLFRDILERRALSCVFQPILSFAERRIYGYEALIRGPKDSIFQSPVDLFDAAQDTGSVVELSVICVNTVLRHFAAQRLPGKLFLNISPGVVTAPGFDPARGAANLKRLGLHPEQVIIELTEHHPAFNFKQIHDSLLIFRAMGFQVAIDDLGEGFSSLRLWSELKPAFVKADKHFVRGISADPIKVEFMKAIQQIAETCGSMIIAEGIESREDFLTVRELGVALGQGYVIGRPQERPSPALPADIAAWLDDGRVAVLPTQKFRQSSMVTAQHFLREVVTTAPGIPVRELIAEFERSPACYAIPVVDAGRPVGLVARRHVRHTKTLPAGADEYDRDARDVMNVAPLIVDRDAPLTQVAAELATATPQHLADGFIITEEGRYLGMGFATDVLRVMTDTHLTAARYTHPLTLLPGPVPVNEHIERLLGRGHDFAVCLAEIEPMKGFNDALGFAQGDELIRQTGRLLTESLDPRVDLAGHVYGNRFVLVMQSTDWQARLRAALERFRAELAALLPAGQGGTFEWHGRNGRTERRPLPRLAMGAAVIAPAACESRHDVMALAREANAQAAQVAGSNLHVLHAAP